MITTMPLRYEINDWAQAVDAKSNNSEKLHIKVSTISDTRLKGQRISLEHDDFGTLFCTVVNPQGSLIDDVEYPNTLSLTNDEILQLLRAYGFFIYFTDKITLPEDLVEYLKAIQKLGYDKIRLLNTHKENPHCKEKYELGKYDIAHRDTPKVFKWHVVAFKVEHCPYWINNNYTPSMKEYEVALENGEAIDLTAMSKGKGWDWTWLDFVGDIEDILNNLSMADESGADSGDEDDPNKKCRPCPFRCPYNPRG